MNDRARLKDLVRRAHQGDAWHGPALMEVLSDVSTEEARARPIANAHSISEIARHIVGTRREVLRRFEGFVARDLSVEEDWPAATDPTADEWLATLAELDETQRALLGRLEEFPEARLDDIVAGRPNTFFATVCGIAEHDVYHAGQIALLKKAVRRDAAAIEASRP
jgi:uncharacterized damage-inducible protein DinB